MQRSILLTLLTVFILAGCGARGPAPINYGTDLCDYCDMTIADKAFGTEMVTTKGKILKYDSIECLAAAEFECGSSSDIHSRWATDFNHPGQFLNTDQAIIVATDRQKSPMGIGLVAVNDRTAADDLIAAKGGQVITWNETIQLVAESWKLAEAK